MEGAPNFEKMVMEGFDQKKLKDGEEPVDITAVNDNNLAFNPTDAEIDDVLDKTLGAADFKARVETAEEVAKRHAAGDYSEKELAAKKLFEDHIAQEGAARAAGTDIKDSGEFAAPVEDEEIDNALGALN